MSNCDSLLLFRLSFSSTAYFRTDPFLDGPIWIARDALAALGLSAAQLSAACLEASTSLALNYNGRYQTIPEGAAKVTRGEGSTRTSDGKREWGDDDGTTTFRHDTIPEGNFRCFRSFSRLVRWALRWGPVRLAAGCHPSCGRGCEPSQRACEQVCERASEGGCEHSHCERGCEPSQHAAVVACEQACERASEGGCEHSHCAATVGASGFLFGWLALFCFSRAIRSPVLSWAAYAPVGLGRHLLLLGLTFLLLSRRLLVTVLRSLWAAARLGLYTTR